ncbi:MAG: SusC/RagA family TonB-linked outer membrane protein [Tunicatimonas sp.]
MKNKFYSPLRILLLGCLSLLAEVAVAQSTTVSGTVSSAADGFPLPGVSIVQQGTINGTQSDVDGSYSLAVPQGSELVFSYIGMASKIVEVGASTTIDVTMQEDVGQLQEVVVTALGIERQKESLTYATQEVEIEGIDEARDNQNIVNSLSGRVAGLSVQRAGNGVSGGSRVVLRGLRSIGGNSFPLYVVDGVPLGGDIADLSPDDIASINVLRGANAAALYGARANNGAIIITTKSGRAGGGMTIDLNNTVTLETANILWDYQNAFGQGSAGQYEPLSLRSFGAPLDGRETPLWSPSAALSDGSYRFLAQPDNVRDFFQTGVSVANNLSIRSGNERTQTFFSYTHENRKGTVPGNELSRHNVSLKLDNQLLNDKLKLSSRVNYLRTTLDNELETGRDYANPVRHALRLPRNIRTQDISTFEFVNEDGNLRQNYWNPGSNGGANPYWTANRNLNQSIINRIIGYAMLTYQFTPNLSLMGRTAVDQSVGTRTDRDYVDFYIFDPLGNYSVEQTNRLEWNSDFLLIYDQEISDQLSFNVNLGGNHRLATYDNLFTETNGLAAENIFTISNAINLGSGDDLSRREVNSLYGLGQVAFKNALFLDLTYRSDWSSTLPPQNRRFDYYSAGVSAVVSELVTLPTAVSYLKARASYAEVGNDTDPFQLARDAFLEAGGNVTFIELSSTLPNEDLRPERTKSLEFGVETSFLDSRVGIDATYYQTNSVDQLFAQNVPLASGVSQRFVNGANIRNRGVELVLSARPVQTTNFDWNVVVNYSHNRGKVMELAEGLETLSFGDNFITRFELNVGDEWGNIYSRGFERDEQGRALADDNGLPINTDGKDVLVANYNPDWLAGINNTFTYKNVSVSFLIDMRQGGEVVSLSDAIMSADGVLDKTLAGRDGSLVFGQTVFPELEVVQSDGSPNTTAISAEDFWGSLGGENAANGEAFVHDASNIRLREVNVGYRLPATLLSKTPFARASLSLVGRNLFFFQNSAPFDPEVIVGLDDDADGFESFSLPTSRSIGFNLKLGF